MATKIPAAAVTAAAEWAANAPDVKAAQELGGWPAVKALCAMQTGYVRRHNALGMSNRATAASYAELAARVGALQPLIEAAMDAVIPPTA